MATRSLTIREKQIATLLIIVVFFFLTATFVYKPLRASLEAQERRMEAKRRDLIKNLKIAAKEKAVDKQYEKLAQAMKQENADEQEMTAMLSSIESIASKIDIRISDMKPQKTRKEDFYNAFSVSLSVDGEFDKIVQFLYQLVAMPYRFHVDEMRFEKRSTRASRIQCYLRLTKALIP